MEWTFLGLSQRRLSAAYAHKQAEACVVVEIVGLLTSLLDTHMSGLKIKASKGKYNSWKAWAAAQAGMQEGWYKVAPGQTLGQPSLKPEKPWPQP